MQLGFFSRLSDWFTQPLFRVVSKKEDGAEKYRNFSLCPLRHYYLFTFMGVFFTLLPMLVIKWFIFTPLALLGCYIIYVSTCKFNKFRRKMFELVSATKDNNPTSRHTHKTLIFSTLMFTLFILSFLALGFFTSDSEKTNVFALLILILIALVIYVAWYCLIYSCAKNFLPIPELGEKYRTQLSETSKKKVDMFTREESINKYTVLFENSSFIENFHLSGTISAFFDGRRRQNTIRSNKIKPIVWLFAPVLVPLFILFSILPLLLFASYVSSVPIYLEKHLLAYSSFCWLAWTFYYYTNKAELELFRKNSTMSYYSVKRLADFEKVELQSMGHRNALLAFYQNQGLFILEMLTLAILPFLFAYFSLFPSFEEIKQCITLCFEVND